MNNKKILSMLCLVLALYIPSKIYANNDQVTVKIKVLDEQGQPVQEASVGFTQKDRKLTNEKGETVFTFKKQLRVAIAAMKKGYYHSNTGVIHSYDSEFDASKPVLLTLKKKIKPIAMYAQRYRYLEIPIDNKPIGYDLMAEDWVKPHGHGVASDFIFKFEGDRKWSGPKHSKKSYRQKITVSFSNEKDGLVPFEAHMPLYEDNQFRSDYMAPESGYLASWEQITSRELGGSHVSTKKEERNFYFRVRTKLDEKGNIVSAHYGKIYGDFMSFIYYLNPTLNDRNVEFNPSKNLFKGEKVNRP
jgi:hypothetical protein